MNAKTILHIAALTLVSSAGTVYAKEGGITGRTDATSRGCGGCHGSTATPAVVVALAGPTEIAPGSTHTYTLTLTGGPLMTGGFNASTTGGVLIPGEGTQLVDGELTHMTPRPATDGAITFQFQLTAPAEAGALELKAVGNSTNNDGDASGDDKWNFAAPLSVTVVGPAAPAPAGVEGETQPEPLSANAPAAEPSTGCAVGGNSLALFGLAASSLLLRRRRQHIAR